jgi:hypothetical protein
MFNLGIWRGSTWALLLAETPDETPVLTVFIWFAGAAVLALGGFYVVRAVRRWIVQEDAPETFTIQDLREMRARGDITDPEFAAMRAKLLAQLDLSASDAAPPDEAQGP